MDEVKYEFYFNQKLTKEEPVKTVVAGFWLIKGGVVKGYLPEMMELADEENESLLEKGKI